MDFNRKKSQSPQQLDAISSMILLSINEYIIKGKASELEKIMVQDGRELINALNREGNAPLHLAVLSCNLEITRILLNVEGVDANLKNSVGLTPLLQASIIKGQYKMVALLLDYGADPNSKDKDENSALNLAVAIDDLAVAEMLINANADVDALGAHGFTPLMTATSIGSIEMMKLLLSRGVSVFHGNDDLISPVSIAIFNRNLQRIRILLDSLLARENGIGMAINELSRARSQTPLHIAVEKQNEGMISYFLKLRTYGLDINVKNQKGLTALHVATSRSDSANIVKMLLDAGADPFERTDQGHQALHLAVSKGNFNIVTTLLQVGADVNGEDGHKLTAIMTATRLGDLNMMRLLIEEGAKVDDENIDGFSALKIAAYSGSIDRLRLLLDKLFKREHDVHKIRSELIKIKRYFIRMDESALYDYIYQLMYVSADTDLSVFEQSHKERVAFELFRVLPSPIKFINKLVKVRKTDWKSDLISLLEQRMLIPRFDHTILRFLVRLDYYARRAGDSNIAEKKDLLDMGVKIQKAISEIFNCDYMDSNSNVLNILLPEAEKFSVTEETQLMAQFASCFEDRGLIGFCIAHDIKILFDKPQIARVISKLFYTSLKGNMFPEDQLFVIPLSDTNVRISLSLRSCPMAMWMLEGVSKVFFLFLVGLISIQEYGKTYGPDFVATVSPDLSPLEIVFIVMIASLLMHEVGELAEADWSIHEYLKDEWNSYDLVEYIMAIVWLLFRFLPGHFGVCRFVLAVIAIPQSLGMLRFFSVYKPVGELVITYRVMIGDLAVFLVIYLLAMFGFGVTFTGLFPASFEYGTTLEGYLSLFSASMNNFSFETFNADSSMANSIANFILVIFVVLTSIVLLNLLIARMTNSHQRVSEQAFREWSFAQGKTLQKLLLRNEQHLLCMLPAPFNLVTTAFLPLHSLYWPRSSSQSASISFSGSISTIMLICPLGGCIRLANCISRRLKRILKSRSIASLDTVLDLALLLTTPLWYPFCDFYVVLRYYRLFMLDWIDCDGNFIYNLDHEKLRDCVALSKSNEKVDKLKHTLSVHRNSVPGSARHELWSQSVSSKLSQQREHINALVAERQQTSRTWPSFISDDKDSDNSKLERSKSAAKSIYKGMWKLNMPKSSTKLVSSESQPTPRSNHSSSELDVLFESDLPDYDSQDSEEDPIDAERREIDSEQEQSANRALSRQRTRSEPQHSSTESSRLQEPTSSKLGFKFSSLAAIHESEDDANIDDKSYHRTDSSSSTDVIAEINDNGRLSFASIVLHDNSLKSKDPAKPERVNSSYVHQPKPVGVDVSSRKAFSASAAEDSIASENSHALDPADTSERDQAPIDAATAATIKRYQSQNTSSKISARALHALLEENDDIIPESDKDKDTDDQLKVSLFEEKDDVATCFDMQMDSADMVDKVAEDLASIATSFLDENDDLSSVAELDKFTDAGLQGRIFSNDDITRVLMHFYPASQGSSLIGKPGELENERLREISSLRKDIENISNQVRELKATLKYSGH